MQPVLDDRTANGNTHLFARVAFGRRQILTVELIVDHAVCRVLVERVTHELIRTAARDRVDVTGRETAVFRVERCEFDRHHLDGIVR